MSPSARRDMLLRIKRPKSVLEIPVQDLPRTRVGPGRLVRFWGRDVIAYVQAAETGRKRRK